MDIAFVSTGYYPTHSGGAAISTGLIVDQLRSAGHTVDVFTTTNKGTNIRQVAEDHQELPDGSGYRLPKRIGKNYGVVKNIDGFSGYDVVHVYGFGSLPAVVIRSDVPVIGTANNLEWVCINWIGYLRDGCPPYGIREAVALARQDGYGPLTLLPKLGLEGVCKRLSKSADHITVQTKGMEAIFERCGYAKTDLTVVPNLLDPRFLSSSGTRHNRIIYVGRLVEKKGVGDLVRTFIDLSAEIQKRFEFKLYGDGPLKKTINELAADTIADIEVTYSSYDKLPHEYQDASVLVHGSKYPEPFSRTWLEAMASETPIVCSENPSSRAILDGIAEFYDPFDTDTLRRALQAVLADPERRSKMATRGKAAVQRFQPENVVSQYISIYNKFL